MEHGPCPLRWCVLAFLFVPLARAQTPPIGVKVAVTDEGGSAALAPRFMGLSYETSMLLPQNGRYYFDSHDRALVQTFRTLGIRSLRVGGNSVDDPRIPVPQEKDIEPLFDFARAAGVKVIYSFRLKNGDPAVSARLARSIAARDADALSCFAIGNEPDLFHRQLTFGEFFAQWKPHYDAILQAVPSAMFDGPSATTARAFVLDLARALFPQGHLKMASDHYYFLGSGRAAEKDPAASRARFLSNRLHADYAKDYAAVGAVLAAEGVPYRIDEMNSCYNGGAKDSSDTYASALWALDCTHWWAARHILGVNYHTGESVGRDGGFGAPNYAAFVRDADRGGFAMRPLAYALLAFRMGAQGRPLPVQVDAAPSLNFAAYAFRAADGSLYLTLINKSYGSHGSAAAVALELPQGSGTTMERMDLVQQDGDVAAKSGLTLGGAEIDHQGTWAGRWESLADANSGSPEVTVAAASATVLRFSAGSK